MTVSQHIKDRDAAQSVATTDAALFIFEHPAMTAPLRITTDPTERLSVDPLVYGTRSRWRTNDPQADPFIWLAARAEIPGDQEDAPAEAQLILQNLDRGIAELLRSIIDRADVSMAVIDVSAPDAPEAVYSGLQLVAVEGDEAEIALTISRRPIEDEQVPYYLMNKSRFPGLHR